MTFTAVMLIIVAPLFNQPYLGEDLPSGLLAYVDHDLRELDQAAEQEFQQRLQKLTGDAPDAPGPQAFRPWWIKRFSQDIAAWLLVEVRASDDTTVASQIRLQVFDQQWNRIAKQSFQTGIRYVIQNVAIDQRNPLKQPLLVAEVRFLDNFLVSKGGRYSAFETGKCTRQFFAFSTDQFVTVRAEDDHKQMFRISNWSTEQNIGPSLPAQTKEQLVQSLRSGDSTTELATMVWLSAYHMSSRQQRVPQYDQESLEQSKLFEQVCAAQQTEQALHDLTKSRNPWVRDYAKTTLDLIMKMRRQPN